MCGAKTVSVSLKAVFFVALILCYAPIVAAYPWVCNIECFSKAVLCAIDCPQPLTKDCVDACTIEEYSSCSLRCCNSFVCEKNCDETYSACLNPCLPDIYTSACAQRCIYDNSDCLRLCRNGTTPPTLPASGPYNTECFDKAESCRTGCIKNIAPNTTQRKHCIEKCLYGEEYTYCSLDTCNSYEKTVHG